MSTILEKTSSVISYPISYDSLKIFLLLTSSILLGYTLQPVPKWLNKLFDTSHLLKFIIIFISGLIAVYPVTPRNFMYVTIFSIVVLVIFSILRYVDTWLGKEEPKLMEKKESFYYLFH